MRLDSGSIILNIIVALIISLNLSQDKHVSAFTIPSVGIPSHKMKQTCLSMSDGNDSVVMPNDGVVGVVGRGFVSILTAKIAAVAGYDTWILYPEGEESTITKLIENQDGEIPKGFSMVSTSQSDIVADKLPNTNALIIAVDDDEPVADSVLNFLLDTEKLSNGRENSENNLKRVVAMSRNLNGKNMGFFVKASKISANSEVWDGSTSTQYKAYEKNVQNLAAACGADYTIVRAGTLKGGAGGESYEYDKFLSPDFYEMTKKDIVTWQLLFDCNVRGVTFAKGDVMPGPGNRAVFTACGYEALPGDTSRCGIAEAMIKSLSFPLAANIDFGVGTAESRTPPSDEDWSNLFNSL